MFICKSVICKFTGNCTVSIVKLGTTVTTVNICTDTLLYLLTMHTMTMEPDPVCSAGLFYLACTTPFYMNIQHFQVVNYMTFCNADSLFHLPSKQLMCSTHLGDKGSTFTLRKNPLEHAHSYNSMQSENN